MSPVDGDEVQAKNPIPYSDGQIKPVVLSRFLGYLIQIEIENRLGTIPNETLILWGALDSFVQSEWGNYLNQILRDSKYLKIPGEYHNIATSDPVNLSKHILKVTTQAARQLEQK